ncbi:MAG TPA: sialate O-acetylesterase [Armatimonadota bacterium]
MKIRALFACIVAGASLSAAYGQNAKPFLSPMFGSHMVLQRGIKAPIWGWTTPGARVSVIIRSTSPGSDLFRGKSASTVAGADGKWLLNIGPLKAGGPYELTVYGPHSVILDDVLVGDVWVGSGQSNMQMSVSSSASADLEIAAAKYPRIRLFTVPDVTALTPQETAGGEWTICSPETVGGFSAAAYFFGRDIQNETKVPIGLISTCWGGTLAEAWTSREALAKIPDFVPALKQLQSSIDNLKPGSPTYEDRLADWWKQTDPGSSTSPGWERPDLKTGGWKTMDIPSAWEDAGLPNLDGVVWFRREFTLSAEAASHDATLHLGPIDDRDVTFVNGVNVGETSVWDAPRIYKVPSSALKAGVNVIAIRVLDTGGAGGITGKPAQVYLEPGSGPEMPLAGPWSYKVSVDLAKSAPLPVRLDSNPNVVTVLYNAMIAPVIPFGIKGAIWYQGEANAGQAYQYRTLLPAMINDWRSRWGVGEFPFYIVQLANFMEVQPVPKDDAWAELREAQSMTAKALPHSGIAVAIDIGNGADIHPKNKQEVGRRLALNALAKDYGQKVEFSGPDYKSLKVEGAKIRLTFTHVAGGLEAKGDKLTGFAIAGADRKFVWADAAIDGDSVVVSAPGVTEPVAVRYAWASNPVCNLYNKASLPASPFRTDDWPGITQPK